MNIDEIRIIEKEMVRILPIFFKEMVEYVPVNKRRSIEEMIKTNRANQLIGFDNGMGAWCDGEKIIFSAQNSELFLKMSEDSEYGSNKEVTLVSNENFIDNDKDYVDYMKYIKSKGMTELEYCLEILPHQIMHLIGSSGGLLGEGITELRTREICKKYDIKCAPVLHPKEMKLVRKIETVVGKMILNEASFLNDFSMVERILGNKYGEDFFKKVYGELCIDYRNYTSDRTPDPIEHYKKYREIEFDKIYNLFETANDNENDK